MYSQRHHRLGPTPNGFSLLELITVVVILGVIAAAVLPRVNQGVSDAKVAACHTNRAEIELQAGLWQFDNGSWPAANLSDIGTNLAYFPEGVLTCPVDGSTYTIDTSTGRVIGHDH